VGKSSAVLLFLNETAIPLDADHVNIVKFERASSNDCEVVAKTLAELVERVVYGQVLVTREIPPTSTVPPLRVNEGGWELKDEVGLQLLHPARTVSNTLPSVDIIFVHGLGGSARKTWTQPLTKSFWPTWLHEMDGFKNCRILTFGYDANIGVLDVGNELEIPDFATQLLHEISSDYYRRGREVTPQKESAYISPL